MINRKCLTKADVETNIIKSVRKQQPSFTGHRCGGLENIITPGKMNGERGSGG